MKQFFLTKLFVFTLITWSSFASSMVVLDQSNRSTINEDGSCFWCSDHIEAYRNGNYFTSAFELSHGKSRSFFVFDLSGITEAVTSAEFHFTTRPISGAATLELFDFIGNQNELSRGRLAGDPAGISIFNDIGTGVSYGSLTTSNSISIVSLNAAAISAINNSSGSGNFVFGLAVSSGAIGNSSSGANNITQLVLNANPIPVPAGLWLFGSALIGLAGIKYKK